MTPLGNIRAIDYTVIFARDLEAMRAFYADILRFPVTRRLGDKWIEFTVGAQTLALTVPGALWPDKPVDSGQLSLQLAFRVAPSEVAECAQELADQGVTIEAPVTDHEWGHRTLFFRDPDGNILEIYAEI